MQIELLKLICTYGVIQSALLIGFTLYFKLSRHSLYAFFLFNLLWHTLMYFYLISNKKNFYNIESKKKLTSVNLANTISLFRASAVFSVCFLIWHSDNKIILIYAICYASLVFISDALDGFIARKNNETTNLGKKIDSISDYALLVFMSGLFCEKEIIPFWFFIILFIRLFIQAYGMIKFAVIGFPMKPQSTIGGKLTVAGTMGLYFLAMISLLVKNTKLQKLVKVCTIICSAVIILFVFEKLHLFAKHWKKYKQQKKQNISKGN